MNFHKNSGFTLVEVLVSIGILVILIAIVLPTFHIARERSKTTTCLSNLKQIGTAISLYANDYDGYLPFAANMFSKELLSERDTLYGEPLDEVIRRSPDFNQTVKAYGATSSLMFCPTDFLIDVEGKNTIYKTWFSRFGSSYIFDEEYALQHRLMSSYPLPAQNLLVYEPSFFHGGSSGRDGLTNVLFVDLHVKTITWKERTSFLELGSSD